MGTRRTWVILPALHARAAREGWGLFESGLHGLSVQRDDSPDDPAVVTLPDDDAAIVLARRAGVPCQDDGTFPPGLAVREETDGARVYLVTLIPCTGAPSGSRAWTSRAAALHDARSQWDAAQGNVWRVVLRTPEGRSWVAARRHGSGLVWWTETGQRVRTRGGVHA